jgi:hypothetical protein
MPSLQYQRIAGHTDHHDASGDDDAVCMTGLGSLAHLLARQAVQEMGRLLPSSVPPLSEKPDHV